MAKLGKTEVEVGPAMRTALDVLDYVSELLEVIPPGPKFEELAARANTLTQTCNRLLKEKGK